MKAKKLFTKSFVIIVLALAITVSAIQLAQTDEFCVDLKPLNYPEVGLMFVEVKSVRGGSCGSPESISRPSLLEIDDKFTISGANLGWRKIETTCVVYTFLISWKVVCE